ncbi:hypothetical protein Q2Y22_001290 [Vibrio vulnificus]|nr:hypothetical protein [Vibrio vulnificus]
MGYKHLTLIALTTVTCFSINAKTLPCYISTKVYNSSDLSSMEKQCARLVTTKDGTRQDTWELPILYYEDPKPDSIIGSGSDGTKHKRKAFKEKLANDFPLAEKCMESYSGHTGSVAGKSITYNKIEKKHHGTYVDKANKLIQLDGFSNEITEPTEFNLMCVLR